MLDIKLGQRDGGSRAGSVVRSNSLRSSSDGGQPVRQLRREFNNLPPVDEYNGNGEHEGHPPPPPNGPGKGNSSILNYYLMLLFEITEKLVIWVKL